MPCIVKARLPRWNPKKGWTGGDSKALYAFTDKRTGRVKVAPGTGDGFVQWQVGGPEQTVRLATRAEAQRLWQKPLHKGWKVSCPRGKAVRRIIKRRRRR